MATKDNTFTDPAKHTTDSGADFYPDGQPLPAAPDAVGAGVYTVGNAAYANDRATQDDQPPGPEHGPSHAPAREIDGLAQPRDPVSGKFRPRA